MRRVHPLWRGFWLACAYVAALTLLGGIDWLAACRGQRQAMAMAGAVLSGAFLASLPGLLRRNSARGDRFRWPQLLTAFICGLAMTLSCAVVGTGRIIPALLEGSTGAYAFVGMAALAAFITARIAGRRGNA